MIQGGDPNTKDEAAKDTWGPGRSRLHHQGGVQFQAPCARRALDGAHVRPEFAGSQFFICHGDAGFLDGQYTVFGKLIKGDDVLEKIATRRRNRRTAR